MFPSPNILRLTVLLVVTCVLLSGCFLKRDKETKFLIPEMDTASEQMTLAQRQFRDANGIYDAETREKELRKAIQAYEAVGQRFPHDMRHTPYAELMIANIRREIGQAAAAETQYRRVLARYSDDEAIRIDALIGLGQTLDDLGRAAEAKVNYKMVIDQYASSDDPAIRRSVEFARARYVQIREI
jgi:TolA-binding protein